MNTIFLPLLVQVGLTLSILVFVPQRRIADIKADPSLLSRAKVDSNLYSEASKQVANSYNNQFQLPILFYVACIFAIMFSATGLWAGIFAWGFVLTRIVHAYIHCGSNNIRLRFYAFAAGLVMLVGLWVVVVIAGYGHPMMAAR